MIPNERPLTDVLKSILKNVEDIVRSEVKLVKAEVRQHVAQATFAAGWIIVGTIAVLFAVCFGLLAAFFGLSLVMPEWLAAGLIAFVLAIVGVSALLTARHRRAVFLIRRTL